MRSLTRQPHLVALLLSSALVCACGGGGGDATTPGDLLRGTYQYARLAGISVTGDTRSSFGTFQGDGRGTVTFGGTWVVQSGTVAGPVVPSPATYGVTSGRVVTVRDHTGTVFTGRVTGDGSVAALTTRQGGEIPSLLIAMRRAQDPRLADLVGTWFLMEFGQSANPAYVSRSVWGTVEVDATGALTFTSRHVNYDGVIDPGVWMGIDSRFAIGSGGDVLLHTPAAGAVWSRGGVSEDRGLVLLGGELSGLNLGCVQVLVRLGQAAGNASLDGSYDCNALGYSPVGYYCGWGVTDLGGHGLGSQTSYVRLTGDPTGPHALDITYSIGGAGAGTLVQGTDSLTGAVGRSGMYGIWGGGYTPGSAPTLYALIR